jgi:CBS domain-containing protein
MFVMIITDKAASKLYLNLVKAISGMVRNETFFNELCDVNEPNTFITKVHSKEVEILNEITVGDVMNTKFITVKETTTLRELADLIETCPTDYFPVIDLSGKVTGEITIFDYLKVGIPKYTRLLENVKFPKTIEPLEDIFLNEDTMTAKDIMVPISYNITTSSSISEAVFQMIKKQRSYLAIFKENLLVVGCFN